MDNTDRAAEPELVDETPSLFPDGAPIRTYSDGSQTYGPYGQPPAEARKVRAADLPEGSVVANDKTVWMAACDADEYGARWDGLLGSETNDAEIDRLLAHGAQVLRVGTGKKED